MLSHIGNHGFSVKLPDRLRSMRCAILLRLPGGMKPAVEVTEQKGIFYFMINRIKGTVLGAIVHRKINGINFAVYPNRIGAYYFRLGFNFNMIIYPVVPYNATCPSLAGSLYQSKILGSTVIARYCEAACGKEKHYFYLFHK